MFSLDQIFSYSDKSPLLFNQYLFLFLFTLMFAGFSLVYKKVRVRNLYLLVFSLFFYYKCSGFYAPDCEGSVAWDSVGISWPISQNPVLSDKDARAPTLAQLESPFEWSIT